MKQFRKLIIAGIFLFAGIFISISSYTPEERGFSNSYNVFNHKFEREEYYYPAKIKTLELTSGIFLIILGGVLGYIGLREHLNN